MFSIIYKSNAVPHLTEENVQEILQNARAFNQLNEITGCLLYHNGQFLQLIEGDERIVSRLYERIKEDGRHTEVTLLKRERSFLRAFKNWNMLYSNLDQESLQVDQKRQLFDAIFHEENSIVHPGTAKLVLWKEIEGILRYERESCSQD